MKHEIDQIRPFLRREEKGRDVYWIKTPNPWPVPRDPVAEHDAYRLLGKYLSMPRCRLLNGDQALVVKGVAGYSAEQLISTDVPRCVTASEQFWRDSFAMWDATCKPSDESSFKRNLRTEGIAMLNGLKTEPRLAEVMDRQIVVNETEYPVLRETVDRVIHGLENGHEDTMVVRHGDEQIGNIMYDGLKYYAIDPAYSGYGFSSQAANVFIGSNYIFYYHWNEQHSTWNGTCNIRYLPTPASAEAVDSFKPLVTDLEHKVDSITHGTGLLREYLFVNFLRVAAGKIGRPENIDEVLSKPHVYIALANEAYYGKI